jgi:hypothetical protein
MAKLPNPKEEGWIFFIVQCIWQIFLYCLLLPGLIWCLAELIVEARDKFVGLSLIKKILALLFIGIVLKIGHNQYLKRQQAKNNETDD